MSAPPISSKIYWDVARNYGASQSVMFRRIVFFGALPTIFAGLRIALAVSFIVLVASEFVATKSGIGYLIWNSWELLQVDVMFVGIVTIGVLGLITSVLFAEIERKAIPWKQEARRLSPPGGVALHTARIGGGAAAAAVARGGGEPALAPVGIDLDHVAAPLELATVAFGSRPSTTSTPGRAVRGQNEIGKCSECHAGASIASCRFMPACDVAHEELRRPLVLLVAAGRAPGEVGLAIAQRERRRERGARPLARRERGRMAFLQPEHLRARAEAEAELRE